jgi:hypothetical protein
VQSKTRQAYLFDGHLFKERFEVRSVTFDPRFYVDLGVAVFVRVICFAGLGQQVVITRSAHHAIAQMLYGYEFRQVRNIYYIACSFVASVT